MCKEGWCVGLGQEEGRGQAGSRGGCLKNGGLGPLMNYDSVFAVFRAQSTESKKSYVQ